MHLVHIYLQVNTCTQKNKNKIIKRQGGFGNLSYKECENDESSSHCWPQISTQPQIPGWKMVQRSCSIPCVLRAWCLSPRDRQHGKRINITVDHVQRLVSMIFLTWMVGSCLRISPPLVHRGLYIVPHITYPPCVSFPLCRRPVEGAGYFQTGGQRFKEGRSWQKPRAPNLRPERTLSASALSQGWYTLACSQMAQDCSQTWALGTHPLPSLAFAYLMHTLHLRCCQGYQMLLCHFCISYHASFSPVEAGHHIILQLLTNL